MTAAPAAFTRVVTGASCSERKSFHISMPAVVRRPRTLMDSFSVMGSPSSGASSPRTRRASAASASRRARSKSGSTIAFSAGLWRAMRPRCRSSSSTADTRRARSAASIWVAVANAPTNSLIAHRGGPRHGPPHPPSLGRAPAQPGRASGLPQDVSSLRPLADVVEPRAVVPEDLGLRLVAHALERDELVHGLREQPVGVRVVGRDDDVVVADRLHHLPQHLLVGVGGHVALAIEVFAGKSGDLHLGARAELLPRLVEPPEPPRQPAARTFEERAAEPGVALEHA